MRKSTKSWEPLSGRFWYSRGPGRSSCERTCKGRTGWSRRRGKVRLLEPVFVNGQNGTGAEFAGDTHHLYYVVDRHGFIRIDDDGRLVGLFRQKGLKLGLQLVYCHPCSAYIKLFVGVYGDDDSLFRLGIAFGLRLSKFYHIGVGQRGNNEKEE